MGSDLSESVYREAVSKLRVLLSATEHPTLRISDKIRGEKSKSLDHLYAKVEEENDVKEEISAAYDKVAETAKLEGW